MKFFELAKASHCVGECNYHLQFTVAYRRKIFENPDVKNFCEWYIAAEAKNLKIILVAIDFGPDHVHIFVANCKNYGVAQLARLLKGFTSYMMRKNHRPLFVDKLWGRKFWSGGYFYRSIGSVTSESIKFYIEHCQDKHWEILDAPHF